MKNTDERLVGMFALFMFILAGFLQDVLKLSR